MKRIRPIMAAIATMAIPTPIPTPAPADRPEDDFAEFDWDDAPAVDVAVAMEEPGTAEPADAVETAPDEPDVVAFEDPEVVGEDVAAAESYWC
jgi:hypothetical protein